MHKGVETGGEAKLENTLGGDRLLFYRGEETSSRLPDFFQPGMKIDTDSIRDFLLFGTMLPPRSPVEGVRQVYPGEKIVDGKSDFGYRNINYSVKRQTDSKYFIDAFDACLTEHFSSRKNPEALLLSGGIDSAILASYLPKDTTYITWGGRGALTDDIRYARVSAAHFGGGKHVEVLADYDRDLAGYKEAVQALGFPILFNSAVPFIRMAQAARDLGISSWCMGQNADTLFMAYPAPLLTKRLHYLNTFLPFNPAQFLPDRRSHLFSTPSIIRLFAYFKSLGIFPGHWISIPDQYFTEKEALIQSIPFKNIDQRIIVTEELLTESRRNQICQNELPALFGISTDCPYYDQRFIETALTIPQTLRRKAGYSKYLLKELARRRGVPTSIIDKTKTGLSYGFEDIVEAGRHLPVWEAMEKDEELNRFIRIKELRAERQNEPLTFLLVSSLHYWLELVARPRGISFTADTQAYNL